MTVSPDRKQPTILKEAVRKARRKECVRKERNPVLFVELDSFMEDLACNERLLCPLLNTRFGTMTTSYLTSK